MRNTLLILFTLAIVGGLTWYFWPEPAYQQPNGIIRATNEIKNMESKNTNEYVVDTLSSTVEWFGKKILVPTEHRGNVKIDSGLISFEPDKNIINGSIVIDMNTISDLELPENMRPGLEKHLKSADFFDVANYPTARIEFKQLEKIAGDQYNITGLLTIKGTTNPISFPANIKTSENKIEGEAAVEFDRSLYNVQFGSGKFFQNLGDKIIDDIIRLKVKIIANR